MTEFVYVDHLPSDVPGGWCAHYNHIPLGATGWKQCDIRATIAANQERWIDEFDEWHSVLCSAALSVSHWWWLMPGSRPNVWVQHETLKPFFFAVAVYQWRRSHQACVPIYLVGCPPEVRLYLQEFEEHRKGFLPSRSMLLSVLCALIKSVMIQVRVFRSLIPRALCRPSRHSARLLFYSHVVDARALNEVGDHFFGDMFDIAECAMPGEVIVSYLLHNENERQQAIESLLASNRHFSFVLDHLNLWDLLWIFVTGVWAGLSVVRLSRVTPVIRLGHDGSRLFSLRYVMDQILRWPPSTELAIYRAMRRLLRRCGVQTVLYPYEEKALERAILRACSEASTPIRTLAYAHAAYTTCHLALRARRAGCPSPPQPNKILATGPRARDFLVDWGRKHATEVIAVGSPRYLERCGDPRSVADRRNGLRVLVLAGHAFELSMLANMIEWRNDLFANDEVIIRRYPFADVGIQDRASERLSKLSSCFRMGEESLEDQIEWCDLALFNSTTAGLQAMLCGRLAVYVALHDILEADPLLGSEACFARCATADQLANTLVRARTLPDSEYAYITGTQREYASSILSPFDKAKLIDQLHCPATPWDTGGEGRL